MNGKCCSCSVRVSYLCLNRMQTTALFIYLERNSVTKHIRTLPANVHTHEQENWQQRLWVCHVQMYLCTYMYIQPTYMHVHICTNIHKYR